MDKNEIHRFFSQELEDSAEEWNWQGMNVLAFVNLINLLLRVTSRCIC